IAVRTACAKAAVRPAASVSAPVSEPAPVRMPVERVVSGTLETAPGGLSGSPLDRRLNFDTFLVGRSNALAHAAAVQVARALPGDPVRYNPLYIHASVGLGKSHLL